MNISHISTADLVRALRVLERESGVTLRFGSTALRSALDVLPEPPIPARATGVVLGDDVRLMLDTVLSDEVDRLDHTLGDSDPPNGLSRAGKRMQRFADALAALRAAPHTPVARCACGTELTLCAACAVADWQAQP